MTLPRLHIAAIAILTVLLGACGAATSTPAASAPGGATTTPVIAAPAATGVVSSAVAAPAAVRDVCAVITQAEAKTFLGFDPGAGVVSTTDTATACAYGGSLVVVVDTDGKVQFDSKKTALGGQGTMQTLNGVGDSAFAFIVANTIADMEILKGPSLLSVLVQGDPTKQNVTLDALQKLGAMGAGRL
jgi:hypothetical protein